MEKEFGCLLTLKCGYKEILNNHNYKVNLFKYLCLIEIKSNYKNVKKKILIIGYQKASKKIFFDSAYHLLSDKYIIEIYK